MLSRMVFYLVFGNKERLDGSSFRLNPHKLKCLMGHVASIKLVRLQHSLRMTNITTLHKYKGFLYSMIEILTPQTRIKLVFAQAQRIGTCIM